jgi:hypothetical protein
MDQQNMEIAINDFQNLGMYESITNHQDVHEAILIINFIHVIYNNPWNEDMYRDVKIEINEWTENHNVEDWTEDEWTAFMNYARVAFPDEYNPFNVKCYGIYIDNDWLYDTFEMENDTIQLLYLATVPTPVNNDGVCFDLILHNLLDRNILQPMNVYDILIGCTILSNHYLMSRMLETNRIRNMINYQDIPQIIIQQMIQIAHDEFAGILDTFDEHGIPIPIYYNLIPLLITNIQTVDDLILIIRRLLENNHLYDRNGCLEVAFRISQQRGNMELYNVLINIL